MKGLWPELARRVSVGFSTTPSDDASLGTLAAKNIALNSILSRKAVALLTSNKKGQFLLAFFIGGGETHSELSSGTQSLFNPFFRLHYMQTYFLSDVDYFRRCMFSIVFCMSFGTESERIWTGANLSKS